MIAVHGVLSSSLVNVSLAGVGTIVVVSRLGNESMVEPATVVVTPLDAIVVVAVLAGDVVVVAVWSA
jgi:hypothetical protein